MRTFSAALLILSVSSSVVAQDLLIENANIVDPAGRRTFEGAILVREGRIALVGPVIDLADFDGEHLDADGGWLIPGLRDMHTHSWGNLSSGVMREMIGTARVAERMLYVGVTGFLDLFSPEDFIFGLRARQRDGEIAGATIFAAGPCLTAPEGHCTEYGIPTRTVRSANEARATVGDLAEKKPDVVKVVYDHNYSSFPTIDKATLAAVVESATQAGLPTVVHIGTWQDARDAVEVGAPALTHVDDEPIPADLVTLMAERRTFLIPTLAVFSDADAFATNPELLDDELLRSVARPDIVDSWAGDAQTDTYARWREWQRSNREVRLANVRAAYEGGVRIVAGTDSGNPAIFQGWSLHRELEHLVAAGLDEYSALASATTTAGAMLGESWGLEAGADADFVLLEASPLEDIRNTRRIVTVVQRGGVVDRAALLD